MPAICKHSKSSTRATTLDYVTMAFPQVGGRHLRPFSSSYGIDKDLVRILVNWRVLYTIEDKTIVHLNGVPPNKRTSKVD
ncbi:hypothetical protein CR513_55128, partial [Mucuna pruriens]